MHFIHLPSLYNSFGNTCNIDLKKNGDFTSRFSNKSGWLQTYNLYNLKHENQILKKNAFINAYGRNSLKHTFRNCITRFIKLEVADWECDDTVDEDCIKSSIDIFFLKFWYKSFCLLVRGQYTSISIC